MSELYKKLATVRDSLDCPKQKKQLINDVFTQMITASFNNATNPDKLPKRFILSHIFLEKEELEEIFKSLDIGITSINEFNYSYSYGYYYEVFTSQNIESIKHLYKGE